MIIYTLLAVALVSLFTLVVLLYFTVKLNERISHSTDLQEMLQKLLTEQRLETQEQRQRFDEHQLKSLKLIQDSMNQAMQEARKQLTESLHQQTNAVNQRMDKLTDETQHRLKEISGQVDKKLNEGFEKTNATFTDVVKRLTIIDEAKNFLN